MIADAFVFHFAPFESLMQLEDWGMLDRERTLLAALAPHYGRVVVMTYGGADDSGLIDRLPERATLVCNSEGLDTAEYLGTVPSRVCRELEGVRTAVVRTHQMWHGDVAVNTALALRDSGVRTGLIARCGYVWSQFFARSHGASDPRSVEARHVEGEVCRAADVVIATTQRMLDDLSWAHGLDASRTRLIPNYVLDDEPVAGEGARDPQRVLYAGRLTAQKRLDLLIDAVAMLPADLGVVLSIIGQGELEGELRERAERAGVRAEFGPRVPHREMLHAMRRCGVYAQTSAYEGHPRTVIEAMSTGAPTLVTDTDGQGPEVVDGVTGVKAGMDASSIARGLERLLRDRAFASGIGAAAARDVRARFGFSALLPDELASQREALGRAGEGARPPSGSVRFAHPLLHAEAVEAREAWRRSVECFARRMRPNQREAMLRGLRDDIGGLIAAPPNPSAARAERTDAADRVDSCAV